MTNATQNTLNLTSSSTMEMAAFTKAVALLKGIKANFVIVLPDNTQHIHGDLKLEEKKKHKKASSGVPYGTYTAHLRAAGFDTMEVSDVIKVDCSSMSAISIRSTASAMACQKWGNGSVFTNISDSAVEIMRIA